MRRLDLTALEWEILLHRIEVPEAIAGALGCSEATGCEEDDEGAPDIHDVYQVCTSIIEGECGRTARRIDLSEAMDFSEGLTKRVLADAVEGSTWMACALPSEKDSVIAAHIRAGNRLAEKVSAIVDDELVFPEA